jgi:hypothetical protein
MAYFNKVQTSVRTKEPIIQELKPSMARAPRRKPRADPLKSPHSKVGVHYDLYDPKKHK